MGSKYSLNDEADETSISPLPQYHHEEPPEFNPNSTNASPVVINVTLNQKNMFK